MTDNQDLSLDKFKEIYEDGEMTLPSGVTYQFTKLNHKQRLKVFTRFQSLESQGLMFFDSPEFEIIEKIIENSILVDKIQLSKLFNHWEDNASEFFTFYTNAMGAISYPFLSGVRSS